ncbi:hypothetical protein AB0B21_38660 [Streptomyces rimosus]|uniref:hypothetical protein n=1 Tax=Streptomyces rimosus TaxID=1927 RepID=UPI001F308D7A|nr:hypothetical protein [Streptomyces rimosus]
MSERSLSPDWLSSWASVLSSVLSAMVDGFEAKHGVPPGVNEVRLASDDDIEAVGALTATGLAPADLLTF